MRIIDAAHSPVAGLCTFGCGNFGKQTGWTWELSLQESALIRFEPESLRRHVALKPAKVGFRSSISCGEQSRDQLQRKALGARAVPSSALPLRIPRRPPARPRFGARSWRRCPPTGTKWPWAARRGARELAALWDELKLGTGGAPRKRE